MPFASPTLHRAALIFVRAAMLCVSLSSIGCIRPLAPQEPMPVINHPFAPGTHRAPTLFVLMPGRRDRASVFQLKGFLDVVRKHLLDVDIIATDAHYGYYSRGSLVRQLHDEIIAPAHRHGYQHIVLIGVSMGAYGAVRYAMAHPGQVETIVLLSPFVGAGPVSRDIAEAGDEDFGQTRDWLGHFPTTATPEQRAAAKYPHIVLGFGQEDLFPVTYGELRKALQPTDVFTAPGAHLWSTWRALLEKILDAGVLDVPAVKQ